MSNAFGIVQRSMSIDTDLVRLIADNIANAQTPGYQRKLGIQRAEFSVSDASSTASSQVSRLSPLTIAADASVGTLSETREPLDIALNGAGSLVASTAKGEVLIRGGRMHIDDQGQLVMQSGDPVLGVSGPINFAGATVDQSAITITADGTIKVSGNVMGQLRIQSPSNASEQGAPRVVQGFLESSNVDSVTEMVKLMETVRHFEASQRAMRSYDGLLQEAISDLGKI